MAGQTCLIILIALPAVLLQQAPNVFLKHENAHNILRAKRANSAFEEFKKGNLERECYEERCSLEEAREVFENEEQTREFWSKYFDGDQCQSNPCQYGGSCNDGINEYTCLCNAGFEGKNCETVKLQLCSLNNGECDQYCKAVDRDVVCSCTNGYILGENGKSCLPTEKYSCGRRHMKRERRETKLHENDKKNHTDSQNEVKMNQTGTLPERNVTGINILNPNDPNVRIVGGRECSQGECPWQALLVSDEDEGFCGGTILSREFILTAAHCMNQTKYFKVVVGELNTKISEGTESIHKVEKIIMHPRFVKSTYDYDIAVIKLKEAINFTENIIPACIPDPEFADQVLMNEPDAMVSGFGRIHERGRQASTLQMLQVPYIKRHSCKESSTFAITENMFCAGFDTEVKDACQGDSGGPHVTPFKGTYFVTGIVSWGEGCARKGKFGVYTKVSKLHRWLKGVLKKNQV